jgi:hypothetical protein
MATLGEVLAQLRAIRAELVTRLRDVDEAIAQIESLDVTLRPILEAPMRVEKELTQSSVESGTSDDVVASPRQVAEAVKSLLLEKRKPMRRGELVQELRTRRVPLYGKDVNKNLGTIIWRHPHLFVALPELGYWLKDVPLEGVYDPEKE